MSDGSREFLGGFPVTVRKCEELSKQEANTVIKRVLADVSRLFSIKVLRADASSLICSSLTCRIGICRDFC